MDSDIGLNIYDSHARLYDPQVPRFLSMDPLAEKYYSWSPYAYVMNNPMKYMDPEGLDVWEIDKKGRATLVNTDSDDILVRNKGNDEGVKLSEYDFTKNVKAANTVLKHYVGEVKGKYGKSDFEMKAAYYSSEKFMADDKFPSTTAMAVKLKAGSSLDIIGITPLLRGKFRNTLDNKYDMENIIEHEYYHYEDLLSVKGLVKIFGQSPSEILDKPMYTNEQMELRAIRFQRSTPSWEKTTDLHKKRIEIYESKNSK